MQLYGGKYNLYVGGENMDLITIIIVVVVIVKILKKGQAEKKRIDKNMAQQNPWDQVARQAISSSKNTYEKARQKATKSAMHQVQAGRVEARNTTILQRAKKHAEADKVDVTLETMEAEHKHAERVAPAEHHHPGDVLLVSMLGNIEDLMIKGYDGNLCFERDFVGEAMDMLSRFSVPTDIPDFSKNDVA